MLKFIASLSSVGKLDYECVGKPDTDARIPDESGDRPFLNVLN
jgi:hypothetical protein